MTKKKMTPEEEYEFYATPENQEPQGPARRRLKRSNLTEMVPVRFPPETLEEVRRLAEAGLVVDALHELEPPDKGPDHEYYEIVTRRWSERWPAEDVWVAHRPRVVRSR